MQVGAALAALLALGGDAVTRRGDVVSPGCRAVEAEYVYCLLHIVFTCRLPCWLLHCVAGQAAANGDAKFCGKPLAAKSTA